MTAATTTRDSLNGPAEAVRSAAAPSPRGIGWLESFVLLVPGLVGIHLLAPREATSLQLALAALLVAATAGWTARRHLGGAGWFGQRAARRLSIASRAAMLEAGDRLLAQAVADDRPLSVAVLELDDLPELRRLFGRPLAHRVLARTARKLRVVAGPKGLALRTSPTQFTLVLPGVDEEAVLLSLRTVFGDACCIEDEGDADEVVLLPHFQVATVEAGCCSIEQMYAALCERLLWSLHRAREPRQAAREPDDLEHSQPVSLGPVQCELGCGLPLTTTYVPTVPLPLR